jgi:hypothetical protein
MRNILLAVTAAGLVGCVGGIDMPSSPPPGSVGDVPNSAAAQAARKAFEDTVYPIVNTKCVACHSAAGPSGNLTGFVATSASNGYVTAVGYQALVGDWTPAGAPILLKIAAGHNGVTYSDDEKSKITAWLTDELQARAGGSTTTPTTGDDSPAALTAKLTAEWSGCMTLANFTAANMTAWGNMRADNSACKTCHIDGEYGQIASDVADAPSLSFFKTISTNKYYMAQYFSVDVANKKMIVNTRSFTGVGQALAPHTEHPRFTVTNSAGMTALQKFYDSTMASKTAGTCGPPTLAN